MYILYYKDEDEFEIFGISKNKSRLLNLQEELLAPSKIYDRELEKWRKSVCDIQDKFVDSILPCLSFDKSSFSGRDEEFFKDRMDNILYFIRMNISWLTEYQNFTGTIKNNQTLMGLKINKPFVLPSYNKFEMKYPNPYYCEGCFNLEEIKEL